MNGRRQAVLPQRRVATTTPAIATMLLSAAHGCCLCLLLATSLLVSPSAHALTSVHQHAIATRTSTVLSSSVESSYLGRRVSSPTPASRSSNNKARTTTMDLEVPHPTYTTSTTTPRPRGGGWLTSLPTAAVRFPTATTTTTTSTSAPEAGDGDTSPSRPSVPATTTAATTPYFQHFWDKQIEVMEGRLRNLHEIPLPTSAATSQQRDMSVIENDNSRMITKTFRSDAYSYVRMTLLAGKHTQVFTSVWYPSSPHLPILACDLLQFGGGPAASQQRHLCIVDYQPVIVPSSSSCAGNDQNQGEKEEEVARHGQEISERVEAIRQQYPGLHGEMSRRFYPEGSPYFSSQMLLGRHLRTSGGNTAKEDSPPSYGTSDEMVHDVYEAWQSYMDEHVSWAQQEEEQAQDESDDGEAESLRTRRHASYDQFSSKYDPALPMLSHMYGAEFADAYVHDVLFPLSRSHSNSNR